jgi:hypothetical protein
VLPTGRQAAWTHRLHRLIGLAGVLALISWLLVPAAVNWRGLLLVVLIVVFVFWSLLRLLPSSAPGAGCGQGGPGRGRGRLSDAGHTAAVWPSSADR